MVQTENIDKILEILPLLGIDVDSNIDKITHIKYEDGTISCFYDEYPVYYWHISKPSIVNTLKVKEILERY